MNNRMFWLGTICLSVGIGARFGSPDIGLWLGVIGGILLVLS